MYQTVGTEIISAYAECMELPLYRRVISGKPVNQNYSYDITTDDEVEDLFELLCEIKQKHPDIHGVSSGAIRSNYQRIRVENVCNRLGWVSLAYLWEVDQKVLFQEMISSNIVAILIKVAAMGLGKEHLGKSLNEMQTHLHELESKYGSNVCGEGGEFESLTLDCPLFKKKIVLKDTEVITHSDDAFAPVYFLKVRSFNIENKV